ncbi:MAG: hypothetical protein ACUVSU_08720 [Aggregatilineaceae bacterium]
MGSIIMRRWRKWVAVALVVGAVSVWLPPVHAQEGLHTQARVGGGAWPLSPIVPANDEGDGNQPAARTYQVGDVEGFVPLGSRDRQPRAFVLAYRSEYAYFWFERTQAPDLAALEQAARSFDERIWPLNVRLFDPATVAEDSRVHVINQRSIGPGILGAFNPADLCPRTVCPASAGRPTIYLSLDQAPPGSEEYLTTLAHESQHLLQYLADANERRWLNEGLSQLSEHLNGFDPQAIGIENVSRFLAAPDHHLSGWLFDDRDMARNYGAAYLFLLYLYERFGLGVIQAVASHPADGLASIQAVLAGYSGAPDVDRVFADWVLANLLDDPYVGDGRYYYRTLDLPSSIVPQTLTVPLQGIAIRDTVNQYGADYLRLDVPGTYQLSFDGSDTAALLNASPPSGEWLWWSYDNSNSVTRLTGTFDLSGLQTVTLAFDAWWEIEEKDWLQVLVSTDGGATWQTVGGAAATPCPQGLGPCYRGSSGGWLHEQIDLSAFAAERVLVRFEYLTDGGRTLTGAALDNVGIVEREQWDSAEEAAVEWVAEGFLRVQERLPQRWTLAAVTQSPDGPAKVMPLSLDAWNTARATVSVPAGGTVTVVVGAMAPFTATPATYKLSITPAG